MRLRTIRLLVGWALLTASVPTEALETPGSPSVRQAISRALPLMRKSLTEYPRHATCFSCHHQGMGLFALGLARTGGYAVKPQDLTAVVQHTANDLRSALASYRKGDGQPGGITRAGYALLALASGGAKRDEVTDAVTDYLIRKDREAGFWHTSSNRPPSEASAFTDTFLAVYALKTYGEPAQKEAIAERIARARQWLEQTPPKETEDRVFQLWGLKEAGADKSVLQKAASVLWEAQREDGGWAQRPGDSSDAYATGSALTVLCLVSGRAANASALQRGLDFLLRSQQADGSWHVVSRSKPFQPYFESGFPHGKDQFISMAASGWATSALLLASTSTGEK